MVLDHDHHTRSFSNCLTRLDTESSQEDSTTACEWEEPAHTRVIQGHSAHPIVNAQWLTHNEIDVEFIHMRHHAGCQDDLHSILANGLVSGIFDQAMFFNVIPSF